jgi:7-cyano-7-deazaguanine synthase in queuosine biosynthesis
MTTTHSQMSTTARFAVLGEPLQPVQFGYDALLDGSAVINRLARELPPAAADLMEIAATVYVVDQRVTRPRGKGLGAGSTWARELHVEIPVRQPELWNAHGSSLADLLAWLTDDTWMLTFIRRDGSTGPLDAPQGFLFDMVPDGAAPALFSGGMDSSAGLATYLADADAVAVSVDTNNWMQHVQQRVLRELNAVSRHACVPLRYRVSVRGQKHAAESSQRSRGLLFLAAGIATAWTLRQDRLLVFENGIGAINLPYVRSQFGSQAPKAMHPKTLRIAQSLASAVSGRPFRIDAPGMTVTKAELIRRAPAAAARALAGTVSCDTGFSARVRGHAPCGTCTSCILRRQALHAAGKAYLDPASGYRSSSPEDSSGLRIMRWQESRLRGCLEQPEPWSALVSEFPDLLDTAPLAPAEVVGLYRSYVQEWEDLPEAFRPRIGRTAALWRITQTLNMTKAPRC